MTKRNISFCSSDGLYQCKVIPFGMKNSQATFQRLMDMCLRYIGGAKFYVDDIGSFSDTLVS